jgi:hypothetical protein
MLVCLVVSDKLAWVVSHHVADSGKSLLFPSRW